MIFKTKLYCAVLVVALSFVSFSVAHAEDDFSKKRIKMVMHQIRARGVSDVKTLKAMGKVPRHEFVSKETQALAYEDTPLLIEYNQTISQPYIVAYMTEAARVRQEDKVLEIGTGTGYQAAVLAELSENVYTIEIIKPLAEEAKARLKRLGYKNVHVKWGDGYKGWPEEAPFDVIIVTAAPEAMPEELVNQLAEGGRMIIPIGSFYQYLYRVKRTKEGIKRERLLPVRFVPMVKGKD